MLYYDSGLTILGSGFSIAIMTIITQLECQQCFRLGSWMKWIRVQRISQNVETICRKLIMGSEIKWFEVWFGVFYFASKVRPTSWSLWHMRVVNSLTNSQTKTPNAILLVNLQPTREHLQGNPAIHSRPQESIDGVLIVVIYHTLRTVFENR